MQLALHTSVSLSSVDRASAAPYAPSTPSAQVSAPAKPHGTRPDGHQLSASVNKAIIAGLTPQKVQDVPAEQLLKPFGIAMLGQRPPAAQTTVSYA